MSTVGRNIREARRRAGLRTEALAGRVGYSASAIETYERGKIIPKLDVIEALAAALNVPPWELCGWDTPKPKPEPKPGYIALREQLSKLTYKANAEQLDLTVRFLRAMIEPPR